MPTMSYCAVENTANDMRVVLDAIEKHVDADDWLDQLNKYERPNVKPLRALAKKFLSATDEIAERL